MLSRVPNFCEQRDGRLFANARHARDVIGFIADERLVVHHLIRAHAEFANHILIW